MSDDTINGKPAEEHHPRQITDIVIPFEVWRRQDLTRFEIVVYAEIRSLSKGPRGCFATNRYLAGFLGCTTRHLQRCLRRLHEVALLSVERIEGEQPNVVRRVLRALRPWDTDPEWSGRSYPRSAETEDEPDEPPPSQGGVTPRSGGGRHRSHPDKGQVESLESPLPPTPAPSLRDSLVVQSSNEPQAAAAASLYIYRATARHSLNEQASPKENVSYTDSGLSPDKQAPLSIYETEQQQACNCELRVAESEPENVPLAVLGSKHEEIAASKVGEQAISHIHEARETERTLAGGECIEAVGVAANEPGVVVSGSVNRGDGGADAGAAGEPAVGGDDERDGEGGGVGPGVGALRLGAGGSAVPADDAVRVADGPAGAVGGGDAEANRRNAHRGGGPGDGAGDTGGNRVDDVARDTVTVTDEEHAGATALLLAFAGEALSEEDAREATRGRSMARVLEVIGRAGERPAGMQIGLALKMLRDNLPVAPRASPGIAHSTQRTAHSGDEAVSDELCAVRSPATPPVSRREVAHAPSEEERNQMAALKAKLLLRMTPHESAWLAGRKMEREQFGKPIAEKAVEGMTPLKLVVQVIEETHEPRDHLRLAA